MKLNNKTDDITFNANDNSDIENTQTNKNKSGALTEKEIKYEKEKVLSKKDKKTKEKKKLKWWQILLAIIIAIVIGNVILFIFFLFFSNISDNERKQIENNSEIVANTKIAYYNEYGKDISDVEILETIEDTETIKEFKIKTDYGIEYVAFYLKNGNYYSYAFGNTKEEAMDMLFQN